VTVDLQDIWLANGSSGLNTLDHSLGKLANVPVRAIEGDGDNRG